MKNLKKRYKEYGLVLVGADFYSEGGAWRSIHSLYRYLEARCESVLLIDLRRGDGLRQWMCALLFSPRIVVNGMAALVRWSVIIGLFLRTDIAIYLHDTEYALDDLQRNFPLKYRLLRHLLKKGTVLCVSEKMSALYQTRFGSQRTSVVYEVTETNPEPVLEEGLVHIVMTGSLNRRKGYPLFVETAELAKRRGLQWQFHWVGGLGEVDLAPVSSSIKWWGWRESAAPIVSQADAFFLSSLDDPQPLACLEAMALGRRAVVYAATGSSEVVKGLQGFRVFARYDPECALDALQEALSESVEKGTVLERLSAVAGVSQFANRIEESFSQKAPR